MRRKLHGQSNQGTEVSQGWDINEIEDFVEFKDNLNPGNVFCAHPCSLFRLGFNFVEFLITFLQGNKNRNKNVSVVDSY